MGNNVRQLFMHFHDAAQAVADGKELNVNANMVMATIAVTGTGVGFTLIVEGKSHDTDDWTPISVCNYNTLDISPNITANGKYQVSLEAFTKIRTRLAAIGGGAVTSIATIVN